MMDTKNKKVNNSSGTDGIAVRYFCAGFLTSLFDEGAYSNLLLGSSLDRSTLSPSGKRLATMLCYGVAERRITLDYIISRYSKLKLSKLDKPVLQLLRIAVYQLLYASASPKTVVNESLEAAQRLRKTSARGFINALLRGFIRDELKYPLPKDELQRLSVQYSAPTELIAHLKGAYGDKAIGFLESSLQKAPLTIRLNSRFGNQSDLMATLSEAGLQLSADEKIPFCCDILEGSPFSLPQELQRLFHVQDRASQLCCMALGAEGTDIVLDVCAAPGGKTFTIAEGLDGGRVYAFELHENRVGLISDGAKRLELDCVTAKCADSTVFDESIPLADKILCDVVCSGLGVIRRKPEIKYRYKSDSSLQEQQLAILSNASRYLKVDGALVYSTCTLSPDENEHVCDAFLAANPNFQECSFLEELGEPFGKSRSTIFPRFFGSDGFFIAKFIRKA